MTLRADLDSRDPARIGRAASKLLARVEAMEATVAALREGEVIGQTDNGDRVVSTLRPRTSGAVGSLARAIKTGLGL